MNILVVSTMRQYGQEGWEGRGEESNTQEEFKIINLRYSAMWWGEKSVRIRVS